MRAALVARAAAAGWLVALACAAGPGGASSPPPPGRSGVISVEMSGFRSDKGSALVSLFASSRGFPDRPLEAVRRAEARIAGKRARAVLRDLPPGTYAVAVLHDEDGDRKMKTGFLGRPREGYGASNDARGRFGPPKFDDARFHLGPGGAVTVRVRMTYP